MAINFCSARLKTNISSSAVSCEGYDVTNLLSAVPVLQSKGFLAEGFTKPPVSIYLKFFCNVDINHIVLWVEVGRQKTNGLELIAAADTDIYGDKSESDRPVHSSSPSVNVRIGSCKFNHESGVVFQKYNGRFSPKIPTNFLVRHFNTSAATVLRNCSNLEVKIFSTSNSSVPSMKKIEVWGRPGRFCPENVKLKMCTLWDQPTDNATCVPIRVDHLVDVNNRSGCPSTSSSLCEPVVPEDFLDPITLNVMAIPMALPSGKAVDLSTLEKFEAAEAIWGRGPSDPFTGVPFSPSVFPVPDVALKSRIDQFLVENGHLEKYRGVGRTVGREKHNLNKFAPNLGECGQMIGDKRALPSGSQNCSSSCSFPLSSEQLSVPLECNSKPSFLGGVLNENKSSKVEPNGGNQTKVHRELKRKHERERSPPSDALLKGGKGSHIENHEDAVEDSLDCALQSVLTGLPSFVKTSSLSLKEPQEKTANCECSRCLSENNLFTLPCGHLLCRPCLITKSKDDIGKMDCETCHNQYYSSDVIRFHK